MFNFFRKKNKRTSLNFHKSVMFKKDEYSLLNIYLHENNMTFSDLTRKAISDYIQKASNANHGCYNEQGKI